MHLRHQIELTDKSRNGLWLDYHHREADQNNTKNKLNIKCPQCCSLLMLLSQSILLLGSMVVLLNTITPTQVDAAVLVRVCDTREIKTVTSRVCMLYKRTKHSDVKLDKHGNLRMTRGIKNDGSTSPAKLASECCKTNFNSRAECQRVLHDYQQAEKSGIILKKELCPLLNLPPDTTNKLMMRLT